MASDQKTFYYCTNANDIERRHILAVPVKGGTPVRITTGESVETYPTPLASGKYLVTLSADWNIPQSVGVWKLEAEAKQRIVFPASMPGFPWPHGNLPAQVPRGRNRSGEQIALRTWRGHFCLQAPRLVSALLLCEW